jgi:hypothetical protein
VLRGFFRATREDGGRCAVRGFDVSGMMTGWEIVEGTNVEAAIERQFVNEEAAYLHIHFAARSCGLDSLDRSG